MKAKIITYAGSGGSWCFDIKPIIPLAARKLAAIRWGSIWGRGEFDTEAEALSAARRVAEKLGLECEE